MPKRGGSRGKPKPSLKSFTLSRVDADALAELFDELEESSDRGSAILAASILQSELAHLIIHKVDPTKERSEKTALLFEQDAPLSSLYSTTVLGYAMGLFDEATYKDINIIRRVRNAFAHAAKPISFENEIVADECRKLKWRPGPNSILAAPNNLRDRFTFTALGITFGLRQLYPKAARYPT